MFTTILRLSAVMAYCALANTSFASDHTSHPFIGPVGVMGDHVHQENDWMLSYTFSSMTMNGNRSGTSAMSDAQVLSDFMVAPQSMTMNMHMFSLMYGVSERLSVMGMMSHVEKEMDHITRMGGEFTTETKGLGDSKLALTYALTKPMHHAGFMEHTMHDWFLNVGLSLPTGAIDERDDTPAMANAKLPYPMQLGSGTYDPTIGLTYTGTHGIWGWGAQAAYLFRVGTNDEGYRFGNETKTNLWASAALAEGWRMSLRFEGVDWQDIKGHDNELNPMMVPTARTDLRGGTRMDALVGLTYAPAEWKRNRLGVEVGAPIYQSLDGPQLETDLRLMANWQMQF